jgi:hypothetical protein
MAGMIGHETALIKASAGPCRCVRPGQQFVFRIAASALFIGALVLACTPARADMARLGPGEIATEATCQLVEAAARAANVPIGVLTRLIWVESRFRPDVTSPAGAQGIAQFMPGTAAERGLSDPFDPVQAIPRAAGLLADLELRFGNVGLAAAAYNAGPARVANWLAGLGELPAQTWTYVSMVTGRTIADWANDGRGGARVAEVAGEQSCMTTAAALREKESGYRFPSLQRDVDFGTNPLRSAALVSFERARQRYCRSLANKPPLIVGTIQHLGEAGRAYRILIPTNWSQAGNGILNEGLPSLCGKRD